MSGGVLPDGRARSMLVGVGPPVPMPTMAGLEAPKPRAAQQTWQAAPEAVAGGAGASRPSSASKPSLPPMSPIDAQRYCTRFMQLDTDRDGYVQVGLACSMPCHSLCLLHTYLAGRWRCGKNAWQTDSKVKFWHSGQQLVAGRSDLD